MKTPMKKIVILHGHGGKKPHVFQFDSEDSAGAFVGCDQGSTNGLIKKTDPNNLLKGAGMESGLRTHSQSVAMIDQLITKAKKQAKGFKDCCEVKIIVTSEKVGNYKARTGTITVRGGKN